MNNLKVGAYIKLKLKEKGITQEQLAEEMNISSSAVSQVLSGKNMFDIVNLQVLSRILDVSIDCILNAGEEPETTLEILAKKSAIDYQKVDVNLEKYQEKDHKGNKLFDYIIKHENIELIKLFEEKIIKEYANDIRLGTILIKNEEPELFKNFYTRFSYKRNIDFGQEVSDYKNQITIPEYKEEEKNFFRALTESHNEEIFNVSRCFNRIELVDGITLFIYFAIMYDQAHILKYQHKMMFSNQSSQDYNMKQRIDSKYTKLMKLSIKHQSTDCIEYCYSMLNSFKLKNYFMDLIDTKNKIFIQSFVSKYKNKITISNYDENDEKFNNFDSIKELIHANDIELLEYSTEFSNQVALDEALYLTTGEQIEIIKILINRGARFTCYDSYGNGKHVQEPLTAMVKYLLNELGKRK
jgi:transcriptional regulator with XRE-family HTH domain